MLKEKIIFAIILFGCVLFLICGLFQVYRWTYVLHFAETRGVVLSKRIEREVGAEGGVEFVPVIVYRYQIFGRDYQGDTYSICIHRPGSRGGSEKWTHAILDQYQVGDSVTVYYDPKKPEDSILSRKVSTFLLFLVGFPVFVLLVTHRILIACFPKLRLVRYKNSDEQKSGIFQLI